MAEGMGSPVASDTPLPLDGIRVIDLTWIIAGPVCARLLADNGAEVIKLESQRSMDPIRMGGPWLNGVNTGPEGGGAFTLFNRNKLSATLNLKHPEGVALFKRLVAISDVVLNNYTAGTMGRLGLGYDVLAEVNPGIVVAELSGMGATGPYAGHSAYGQTLMALAGAYELTGYPDGDPQMPGYTFADFASPTIGAFAIVSALIARDTTGVGQYIDMGQLQVAAALNAEAQLDALYNGATPRRTGNAEPGALVSGCYRCAGDDEWCVVAAYTEGDWDALEGVIGGLPDGAQSVAVDEAIEAWTRTRSARDVMETLQAAGVEAARVQSSRHLVDDDEHLKARDFYQRFTHLTGVEALTDGIPFKMAKTPGSIRRAGPIYGIDNEYVFGDLLGLSEAEQRRLVETGVIA